MVRGYLTYIIVPCQRAVSGYNRSPAIRQYFACLLGSNVSIGIDSPYRSVVNQIRVYCKGLLCTMTTLTSDWSLAGPTAAELGFCLSFLATLRDHSRRSLSVHVLVKYLKVFYIIWSESSITSLLCVCKLQKLSRVCAFVHARLSQRC